MEPMLKRRSATDPLHLSRGQELNLSRKLRQQSLAPRIKEFRETGKTKAPWVVELDPTTACNLACPDCISGDLLNQGGFSRQRLRDLADEMIAAGVRAVILIGGGEPLAHPEAPYIVQHFAEAGLDVGITTNGTLLDRNLDCYTQNTKWVRVSVDAGTSETFQQFRPAPKGVSMFDEVISNMRLFAERKTGKLGYSFLLLTDVDDDGNIVHTNISEICIAAELAKDIGCDYFEVKPSFNMKHYLIRQPRDILGEAAEQIAAAELLEGPGFRVITPSTLSYVLNDEPLVQPKTYKECAMTHMRTVVTPSGTYVCPYFRGNEDMKVGDVTTQSFTEMWSGEQRAKVMERTDPSAVCPFHCIRHDSNLVLEDIMSSHAYELSDDYDLFI